MSKLDRMIEDALGAEDRAILSDYGEQGLLGQVGGLFAVKLGWWNALTVLMQVLLFAGAFYAATQFMATDELAAMMRWGALSGLLMLAVSVIKLMHWEEMQTNRVIRELKRLQLQIARGSQG